MKEELDDLLRSWRPGEVDTSNFKRTFGGALNDPTVRLSVPNAFSNGWVCLR